MDLGLTEAQKMLQQSARDFLTNKYPLAALRAMDALETGFTDEFWQEICELGWTGLALPSEFGGQDGTLLDLASLYEELGYACVPLAHFMSSVLCGQALAAAATDDQKRRLLPALASGEERWTLAVTEPEYGWAPNDITLVAERSGDGYRISGAKFFVPYAKEADHILVAARLDGEIALFDVDGRAAGIHIRNLNGWHSENVAAVTFENTPVDADGKIVGAEAWQAAVTSFDSAIAVLCSYMTGGLQKVYDMTAEYGRTRVQFGVPIGSFQRVQDRILEIVNAADGARWTAYEAIWKIETGQEDAVGSVSVAKIVASQGYVKASEEAHHVWAGYGADRNLGLWQYTRKARTLYHFLGDPELHRNRLAKALQLTS